MTNTSRISELSSIIAFHTAVIDAHLASERLPSPSFDADAPARLLLDSRILPSRQAILEATDELNALMLGPIGILTSPPHNFLLSLQAIYRFGLATSFPAGKNEATFAEIASASKLGESLVQRVLRHAMTFRIFCEPRKGVVAHTAASKELAVNPLMRDWIGMVSEEMWPAAAKAVDAMAKWPDSEEPNHSGFNIAHNTPEFVFSEFAKYPRRAERYAASMTWFSTGPGLEPTHVLDGYDWSALGDHSLVVDVGGSHGSVSIALAYRFLSMHCIVQDRPEVVEKGRESLPAELKDRVTFMDHDFFTEQPVKDADAYYFRWILHDWSDLYAAKILRALIPALKQGAKIVINEHVLPEPGSMSAYQERALRSFDFAMLEFHNAKERDVDGWRQLFQDADPRFKFLGVRQPEGSRLGLIEAVWEESTGVMNGS